MSIQYLSPPQRPPAHSLVGQVYSQIQQEFGIIADPFRLHAPVPELLAGLWSVMREIGVEKSVPWPVKEAVAVAISQSNACPYCVEIHAAIASAGTNQPLAPLLAQGRTADLTDPSLRSILTWAESTRSPGSAPLLHPPFTAEEAPEILGTTLVYHYIKSPGAGLLTAKPAAFPGARRMGWSVSLAPDRAQTGPQL